MAQGQSPRNRIFMPPTSDVDGSLRALRAHIEKLPIGSTGFHAFHSANQAFNNGTNTNVNLDTLLFDREKWRTTTNSFTVPSGLSGVYGLHAGMYYNGGLPAGVYLSIGVNGVAVADNDSPAIAKDRSQVSGIYPLKDRDVITFRITNVSGGVVTSGKLGPTADDPRLPFLSIWRISLL